MYSVNFADLYESSDWTLEAICREKNLNIRSVRKWLYEGCEPRKSKRKDCEDAIMFYSKDEKKIPFHPSYGYATPEQIKKVESLGIGPERNYLLKQIEKQNTSKGKTRF